MGEEQKVTLAIQCGDMEMRRISDDEMEFEDPTDDYGYNKCNKADREEEGEGTLTLLHYYRT